MSPTVAALTTSFCICPPTNQNKHGSDKACDTIDDGLMTYATNSMDDLVKSIDGENDFYNGKPQDAVALLVDVARDFVQFEDFLRTQMSATVDLVRRVKDKNPPYAYLYRQPESTTTKTSPINAHLEEPKIHDDVQTADINVDPSVNNDPTGQHENVTQRTCLLSKGDHSVLPVQFGNDNHSQATTNDHIVEDQDLHSNAWPPLDSQPDDFPGHEDDFLVGWNVDEFLSGQDEPSPDDENICQFLEQEISIDEMPLLAAAPAWNEKSKMVETESETSLFGESNRFPLPRLVHFGWPTHPATKKWKAFVLKCFNEYGRDWGYWKTKIYDLIVQRLLHTKIVDGFLVRQGHQRKRRLFDNEGRFVGNWTPATEVDIVGKARELFNYHRKIIRIKAGSGRSSVKATKLHALRTPHFNFTEDTTIPLNWVIHDQEQGRRDHLEAPCYWSVLVQDNTAPINTFEIEKLTVHAE